MTTIARSSGAHARRRCSRRQPAPVAVMIVGSQRRAARVLLGLDPRDLAKLCGNSLPTIHRMESSPGSVRAVVASLERVLAAFTAGGGEMIADGAPSAGLGYGLLYREKLNEGP